MTKNKKKNNVAFDIGYYGIFLFSSNTLSHRYLADPPPIGTQPLLLQLRAHLRLHLPPYPLKRQLLKPTERLPPMLARLVLSYAFEKICRPHAHFLVLVEEA